MDWIVDGDEDQQAAANELSTFCTIVQTVGVIDHAVREFMRANKVNLIGAGCYASVYGSRKLDVVYKTGYVSRNLAYLSYIRAIKGLDNPLFPKIYSTTIFTNKTGNFSRAVFIVCMERLQTIQQWRPGDAIKQRVNIQEQLDEFCNKYRNVWQDTRLTESDALPTVVGRNKTPAAELYTTLVQSKQFSYSKLSSPAAFDLHGGNFMARIKLNKIDVVCTDPLV